MPARADTNFGRPTNKDELESMIRDICALEWGDPNTAKNGRSGQKQRGVDVYGKPTDSSTHYRAAQCKLRATNNRLTQAEIEREVKEARSFDHPLDQLIIATDYPRDSHTQTLIDKISEREQRRPNGFRVIGWYWDDITKRLTSYGQLMLEYYPDFYANLTSLEAAKRLVDKPLHTLFVHPPNQHPTTPPLATYLRLRGIRTLTSEIVGPTLSPHDESIDAIVCCPEPADMEHAAIKWAAALQRAIGRAEPSCPIFVLLPETFQQPFADAFHYLDSTPGLLRWLNPDASPNDIADAIFRAAYQYGYARRASLPTIDLTARSSPTLPRTALLDLDWQTHLSTSHFPTPEAWAETLSPALTTVRDEIVSAGDHLRVQINSQLPLPAALALGFTFNVRLVRVGVWARTMGVSDFKHQMWLSDTEAPATILPVWRKPLDAECKTALIELSTGSDIHQTVAAFATQHLPQVDAWAKLRLDSEGASLDETRAVAFANSVARLIRELRGLGVIDTHIFAAIPSALAVLIGQRLQACGRIHLYWYDNQASTYRFAFTLT